MQNDNTFETDIICFLSSKRFPIYIIIELKRKQCNMRIVFQSKNCKACFILTGWRKNSCFGSFIRIHTNQNVKLCTH